MFLFFQTKKKYLCTLASSKCALKNFRIIFRQTLETPSGTALGMASAPETLCGQAYGAK